MMHMCANMGVEYTLLVAFATACYTSNMKFHINNSS